MFYADIFIYLCVEGLLTRPTKLLGVVGVGHILLSFFYSSGRQ